MGPLIIVPRPIPTGVRMQSGEIPRRPVCDRCRRQESDRNPVLLSTRNPWTVESQLRRDAICYECRLAMKGRY